MKKTKNNFQAIEKAIEAFIEKYKGEVCFVGSFFAFDEKGEVVDAKMYAYGTKECIKISLDSLNEEVAKEKDDFINW